MKRKTVSLIIAFVVVISIFLHSWLTGDYKVGFHEPKDLSDLFSLITRAPISFILLIVIIVVF